MTEFGIKLEGHYYSEKAILEKSESSTKYFLPLAKSIKNCYKLKTFMKYINNLNNKHYIF